MQQCLLCNHSDSLQDFYQNEKSEVFWKCLSCGFIFKAPQNHLAKEAASARYRLHQNDVLDSDYQKFLQPVVDIILSQHSPADKGLDFGSGRASVIAFLLRQKKYNVMEYDPLFFPNEQILYSRYDFIACTEVVEHFSEPRKDFETLFNLLKPGGRVYLKTSLVDEIADFSKWYYHRDPTHVGFYGQKSLQFIKENWSLKSMQICKDFIIFDRGYEGF